MARDLSKHDLLLSKRFVKHGLYQNDIKLRGKNFDNFPEIDCDTKIGFLYLIGLVCKLFGFIKIEFMLEASF